MLQTSIDNLTVWHRDNEIFSSCQSLMSILICASGPEGDICKRQTEKTKHVK